MSFTDTTIQSRFTHAELAEMAIAGGADTIQFRQKDGSTRELVESAQAVQAVCAEHGVALIVNDRADIALAVGAAGAHFGQDDLPIATGRRILSPRYDYWGFCSDGGEDPRSDFCRGGLYWVWSYLSDLFQTRCRATERLGSAATDVRNRTSVPSLPLVVLRSKPHMKLSTLVPTASLSFQRFVEQQIQLPRLVTYAVKSNVPR